MPFDRKPINDRQRALQTALARPAEHPEWRELALSQNAACHATGVGEMGSPTWDDALWEGLEEAAARRVPPKGEHSIAWAIWHMARCEDLAMSLLVGGLPQVLDAAWLRALGVEAQDTANTWDAAAITAFSDVVDLQALRGYRSAVGRQTQTILRQLDDGTLKHKVLPERIQQVKDSGGVDPSAAWLTDYWGSRTLAGLILMPATRHLIVHLNEAMRLKLKT